MLRKYLEETEDEKFMLAIENENLILELKKLREDLKKANNKKFRLVVESERLKIQEASKGWLGRRHLSN